MSGFRRNVAQNNFGKGYFQMTPGVSARSTYTEGKFPRLGERHRQTAF
jgi:hypothetical protein